MHSGGGRRIRFWVVALLLAFAAAVRADDAPERVQVADPYLELHTGPGRGYPLVDVVERGAWVEIIGRHTDWFKVVTPQGKPGWASRSQMERTLTGVGAQKTFRDVLVDDYLQRRLEFGFAFGAFESDPILTAFAGYRLHENLSLELAVGQSTGDFSSSRLIYGALVSHLAPDWTVSPYFAIGLGRFTNTPNASLVSAIEVEADMAVAQFGVRYYMTRRFFVRADVREHVALINTDRTDSYTEFSVGVGVFY